MTLFASIIIATFCPDRIRYDLVQRSFEELHRTGLKRDEYEVIIVNNGGIHDDLIDNLDTDIVIRTDRNLGQAAGYNLGISIAKAKTIALMDDDLSYTEGWLKIGLKLLRRYRGDVISLRPKRDKYVYGETKYGDHLSSNIGGIWITSRSTLLHVGRFRHIQHFGGGYLRSLQRLGHRLIVSKEPYIEHLGLRMTVDRDTGYWLSLNNPERWTLGLNSIDRSYYLDIVERYELNSVLDLGCAVGYTCDLFDKNNVELKYIGLDVTPKFVRMAKLKHPETEFMIGMIQSIPFGNNSFEMTTCRAVLEHLPDPNPAIREMARVSSKIVVIVWFRRPTSRDHFLYIEDRGFWHNVYKRDRILDVMRESGLHLIEEIKANRHLVWILRKETI